MNRFYVPSTDAREGIAAIVGLLLLIGVPLLFVIVGGFTALWSLMLTHNGQWAHDHIWRLVSSYKHYRDGEVVASPGGLLFYWLFGVVNLYLLYQFCELLRLPIRGLYRLAVRNSKFRGKTYQEVVR